MRYLKEQTEEEILVALSTDLSAFKYATLQTEPIVKMAIKHSYNLTELKEEVITAEIVLQVLKENPDNFTFFI